MSNNVFYQVLLLSEEGGETQEASQLTWLYLGTMPAPELRVCNVYISRYLSLLNTKRMGNILLTQISRRLRVQRRGEKCKKRAAANCQKMFKSCKD